MKRHLFRIVALAILVTACGDGLVRMTDVDRQNALVGASIQIVQGQNQAGLSGATLSEIRFAVKDAFGAKVPYARGTIAVTAGGGTSSRSAFRTSSGGYAVFTWTLGVSGPQQVTITLEGGAVSRVVDATVIPVGSQLQILGGNNQTGPPGTTLTNQIRVRLTDPLGAVISNAPIRYDIVDGSGGTVGSATKRTNSEGRANNTWKLGWAKSGQQLRAYVAGIDTVTFNGIANATGMTITAIAAGNNQSGPANTMLPTALTVVVKDASNNLIEDAKGTFSVTSGGGSLSRHLFGTNSNGRAFANWTLGASGVQTVEATIPVIGTATFSATIVSGCTSVAIGASVVVNSSTFCLEGGASGSDFTVVPVNVATSGTLSFSLTATNIVATTAVPNPNVIAMRNLASLSTLQAPPDDWEWNFRVRQKRELDALPRPDYSRLREPGGPDLAIIPGVPIVGATMTLNTAQASCATPDNRTGTVKHVSAHLIIIEDNANPINGFTAQDYTDIANKFESDVWNANVTNFGLPSDIDANGGRVIALYTTAVNALTPPASAGFVGGFFHPRDLFPTVSCATSNVGEMFYMLAPDPTGSINGNVRTVADVKAKTVGTLSHEFQHLVNASRRLAIGAAFEEVWLNEGLSHIAEELVYYGVAGRTPGLNIGASHIFTNQANLDAFNTYMLSNFGRLLQWWINPEISGPFIQNDQLRTRGAIWSFLRYAADRKGGSQPALWNALAANAQVGMANLTTQIGTDPAPWFRDWAVGNYTDDLSGANPMPSWNWRDIRVNAFGAPYDLFVRNATAGVALPVSIGNSGAASFIKFRVPASTTSNVTVTAPTATTNVVVFRRN